MGLDTCTLIVTASGVPIKIDVMDADISRNELNHLYNFIGAYNVMKGTTSGAYGVYEIDGATIQKMGDGSPPFISDWNIDCIKSFFGEFLDKGAAEHVFVKDPRSGMPAPKVLLGYRLFMFFEG